MGISEEMFEGVGKAFIFERFRPKIKGYLAKAGMYEVPYSYIGLLFWLSIIPVAYFFMFRVWNIIILKSQNLAVQFVFALVAWLAIHGTVLIAMMTLAYIYFDMVIFGRTQRMEEVLPDFLRLVSENLKGGMPFEKSLWSAIKPEFGILSQEVRLAAKKVMTGTEVDVAIFEFTSKYDSPLLRRSFDLIIEGMKSGGKTAEIIDRVIDTIEETKELKSDMAATNISYVIFVSIVVILVAPGLFTLSFQFLTILQGLGSRVSSNSAVTVVTGMPIKFGGNSFDPENFRHFSRYALMVISTFAGMIISLISKGSIKGGIKFVPFLFIGSQVMYAVLMAIGSNVFASFFA